MLTGIYIAGNNYSNLAVKFSGLATQNMHLLILLLIHVIFEFYDYLEVSAL